MNTLPRHVYAYFSGPYENVGDALIRRRALAWMQDLGEPHLLVGGRPSAEWNDSLGISTSDQTYNSWGSWLRSIAFKSGKRPVLVLEPGEFNTDARFLKLLLTMLFVSIAVRARGGSVVQMPRSMAQSSRVGKLIYAATLLKPKAALWREKVSWGSFRKVGHVVPDIGFDDPDSLDTKLQPRTHLVISLRVDRPAPDPQVIAWLREFAFEAGLEITAVSQVAEDDPRTRELAETLASEVLLWGDSTSNDQEASLRDLYGKTAMVWSDRLHVLVLGALHGAVPIEIVGAPNGKVAKHFDAAGIANVSFSSKEFPNREVLKMLLSEQLERSGSIASSVADARLSLSSARSKIAVAST